VTGPRGARPAPSDSNPGPRATVVPLLLALRAHQREEDHVADRRLIGQQHGQPIDADTLARRRRQPVFERAAVVLVVVHRLLPTVRLGVDLAREAAALI